VDTDGDGIGNNADTDDDGDGVADSSDAYPLDSTKSVAPTPTEPTKSSGGGSTSFFMLLLLSLVLLPRKFIKHKN
ncbi:GlyGly-CTERM sorting domain-containing protein, partial [Colwellia sp. 12G3]|uniref:GlyGly-CTERM sorting domain-containing protein n=1 Tax=Colwellia sp. 12G3 TaxID=2058299 RepID=UPI000CA766FF